MKTQFVPINLKPFDVKGLDEVKLADGFPNCCENHKKGNKEIEDWVQNKFPRCCDYHKEVFTGEGAKRLEYYNLNEVPLKIWKTYNKTIEHINKVFDSKKEDWVEDVLDYVQYCQLSFGLPEVGGYYYFMHLENGLKEIADNNDKITEIERKSIQEILNRFDKDKKERLITHSYTKSNYSKLLQTYQKWYKTLPFVVKGIPKNPFIISKFRTNRYTKLRYYKPIGEKELLELLFDITRNILYKLKFKEYIKKESNEKVSQLKEHLAIQKFDLDQEEMMDAFNNNEMRYVTVLRNWLDGSRKLIEALKPTINQEEVVVKPKEEYNSQIFRSNEAQTWFFDTLEELNALDHNSNPKRGFQAKVSAIFDNKDCKNVVFRYELLLKEYAMFLNNEYDDYIKNTKQLSDGTKYSEKVSELVQLRLDELKKINVPNKAQ